MQVCGNDISLRSQKLVLPNCVQIIRVRLAEEKKKDEGLSKQSVSTVSLLPVVSPKFARSTAIAVASPTRALAYSL